VEITRWPLNRFKVKPQSRQTLGDEAEPRNIGDSLKQRQLSPVGMADGTLLYGHLRVARVVTTLNGRQAMTTRP
jgi:hypothetical protein